MPVVIVTAWCLTGILTVPWLIGQMNKRGAGVCPDPAMDMFLGVALGPMPLAMFIFWRILTVLGRFVYRITGQSIP